MYKRQVEHSTVPVIETGTGNCHIYVDEYADLAKAVPIILNAKTQRIGVCNACESLVIHQRVASEVVPLSLIHIYVCVGACQRDHDFFQTGKACVG